VADATVRNLLLEGHFEKIQQLLDTGDESGSRSFNRDIYRLIKARRSARPRVCGLAESGGARHESERHLRHVSGPR